jgi:hypothetical protein
MKRRRIEKPKEVIFRISQEPADNLHERYAELLRLRGEIRRLAASGKKVGRLDQS